jgi:hypothetical protein
MSETTSPTDRYLAEIDRLLVLHGRERRRALAAARRRLSRLEKEERKRGASDAEVEKRALASLGKPERVAQEVHEWMLARWARVNAQVVLAAAIPILLAITVIALKVLEVRRYRRGGEVTFPANVDENTGGEGFSHHFRVLDLYLPPRYLSLKLALSVCLVAIALILAESALAFVQRRRRLSSGLALAGGGALVAAVSLQIALAFEWHRLHQGHDGWLLAAILVEIGAVLLFAVFLTRAARAILVGRLAPLARAPLFALLALAPMLAVGAKSGFSSTALCTFPGGCGPSPEQVMEYTSGHPVAVILPIGPAGSQGAVALKGRRLAAAIEVWKTQPKFEQPPRPGPVELEIWEGRWSRSQPGPCGAMKPGLNGDPLAPRTNTWCDVLKPRSHRGASWREVVHLEGAKTGAVAAAYRSNESLVVAFSRSGGVYIAESPSWRPRRLLAARAEAVSLAPLPGGELALAAIVSRPGGSALELTRSRAGRWSRPISVAARPGLELVAGGSQIALIFRDRENRLVLERRSDDLSLLEHRTFGVHTRAALGNLRGGRIGVAIADPLRGHALQLKLYRVGRKTLILLTQERVLTYKPAAVQTTTLNADVTVKVAQERLTGVVQTGRIVRALYGGLMHGHTTKPVLVSLWLYEGRLVFASGWPRWAVLAQRAKEETTTGKPTVRWTSFDLTLFQPPTRQLAALDATNR